MSNKKKRGGADGRIGDIPALRREPAFGIRPAAGPVDTKRLRVDFQAQR